MSKSVCLAVLYESVNLIWQRQTVLVKLSLGGPRTKQLTDGLLKTKPLKMMRQAESLVVKRLGLFCFYCGWICDDHTAPSELPETAGARSSTVTRHPALSSACAADNPPIDPPITKALMRLAIPHSDDAGLFESVAHSVTDCAATGPRRACACIVQHLVSLFGSLTFCRFDVFHAKLTTLCHQVQ